MVMLGLVMVGERLPFLGKSPGSPFGDEEISSGTMASSISCRDDGDCVLVVGLMNALLLSVERRDCRRLSAQRKP